jgi:hypothetical protein
VVVGILITDVVEIDTVVAVIGRVDAVVDEKGITVVVVISSFIFTFVLMTGVDMVVVEILPDFVECDSVRVVTGNVDAAVVVVKGNTVVVIISSFLFAIVLMAGVDMVVVSETLVGILPDVVDSNSARVVTGTVDSVAVVVVIIAGNTVDVVFIVTLSVSVTVEFVDIVVVSEDILGAVVVVTVIEPINSVVDVFIGRVVFSNSVVEASKIKPMRSRKQTVFLLHMSMIS